MVFVPAGREYRVSVGGLFGLAGHQQKIRE